MEIAYNTRYGNSAHVSDFSGEFPESPREGRLLATVRRPEDFAEKLASPDETILAYDDMGAPCPAEIHRAGDPVMGIGPADVGEMRG